MKVTTIDIEVVYATPIRQVLIPITVAVGTTIAEAIQQSKLLEQFPDIDLEQQGVGIFSVPRRQEDKVKAGDRVEVYRPLLIDPKVARRQRAAKRR